MTAVSGARRRWECRAAGHRAGWASRGAPISAVPHVLPPGPHRAVATGARTLRL